MTTELTLVNKPQETGMISTEVSRAVQEVQAGMVIAKQFPRNQIRALDRIKQACTREGLAKKACYQFARGGTDITGPSIRLAEAIAQNWENIDFGVKELEQRPGESTVMAYAWDLETNTRQTKIFQVAHVRKAHGKLNTLSDPRDIYELVANQAARRLRSCILGIIPGDVVDEAVEQCNKTLTTKVEITPEKIASMIDKFRKFGISKEMIEKRIQRRMDAITPALMVNLGNIYNSLSDGMSSPDDWFEPADSEKPTPIKKKDETPTPLPPEGVDQDTGEETPKYPQWFMKDYGYLIGESLDKLLYFKEEEYHGLKNKVADVHFKKIGRYVDELILEKESQIPG